MSVFYVYVRCCNLSDKGALIDTFGRHSSAGSRGRGCYTQSACSTQTQNESLSSNGLQNIQSSVLTQDTANIIPPSSNYWTGSVPLRRIAKLPFSPGPHGQNRFLRGFALFLHCCHGGPRQQPWVRSAKSASVFG